MTCTRRGFLRQSATGALAGGFAGRRMGSVSPTSPMRVRYAGYAQLVDPGYVRALALRAVDAARAAGATYADVRLTRTISEHFYTSVGMGHWGGLLNDDPKSYSYYGVRAADSDQEELAVGVRALVNGYWGFAASPYWTIDEMARLARVAADQAKASNMGRSRHVELGTIPVANGSWTMPGIDPFAVSIEEKLDFVSGWQQVLRDTPPPVGITFEPWDCNIWFVRQERALASSEGTYVTQTTYETVGDFDCLAQPSGQGPRNDVMVTAAGLFPQGKGWDVCLDARIEDQVPRLQAEAAELLFLHRKPAEIGRYDVVFDASAAAALLDATVGVATQLDRALGYDANAEGTSYLGPDPLALLGQYPVGSPLLTVVANRSHPGGAATVRWDDEGVVPDEFPLVQNGILVDYQTTREQATWLAPWYAQRRQPVRSHGCAAAPSALDITRQHMPNVSLLPGRDPISFEDLVADTRRGVAILGNNGRISMDIQAKNGVGRPYVMREIVNGKLGDALAGAEYRFTSTDLWRNLVALGGPASVVYDAGDNRKGQPLQSMYHGIAAVPIKVRNVAIVKSERRG